MVLISPYVSVARGVCGRITGDTHVETRVIPFGECSPCRLPVPGCFTCSMEEPPMKDNRRRRPGTPRVSPSLLDHINPNAAGSEETAREEIRNLQR